MIGIVATAFAVLAGAVLYLFNTLSKSQSQAKIAETVGKDKQLAVDQQDIHKAISDIDAGIAKMKAEREASKPSTDKTLEEIASNLNKGLK